MQQNARFIRKLPIPMDIKKEFPITEQITEAREKRVAEMRAILDGRDKRLMLVVGPCSADREDSVMDYVCRLVPLQEKDIVIPTGGDLPLGSLAGTGEGQDPDRAAHLYEQAPHRRRRL